MHQDQNWAFQGKYQFSLVFLGNVKLKGFFCLPLFFQTGLSALHVAAQYGQIEVVREMLLKVSGTIKSESPAMMDNAEKAGSKPDVSQ